MYYMGIGSLSDLTHEEFVNTYNTYRAPQPNELIGKDHNTEVLSPTLHRIETQDDEIRVYSYFAKKFVNSTHEEIETKYVADVIKSSSNRKDSSLPSRIDWRKKV